VPRCARSVERRPQGAVGLSGDRQHPRRGAGGGVRVVCVVAVAVGAGSGRGSSRARPGRGVSRADHRRWWWRESAALPWPKKVPQSLAATLGLRAVGPEGGPVLRGAVGQSRPKSGSARSVGPKRFRAAANGWDGSSDRAPAARVSPVLTDVGGLWPGKRGNRPPQDRAACRHGPCTVDCRITHRQARASGLGPRQASTYGTNTWCKYCER